MYSIRREGRGNSGTENDKVRHRQELWVQWSGSANFRSPFWWISSYFDPRTDDPHTIFDLRLLIQADRVFLINIEETIGSETDNACRVFRHDLKSKLLGSRGSGVSIRLPYELRVVEAALASVTATLEAEYLLAKKKVSETLASLEKEEHPLNSELKTLLDLVRNLVGIEKRGKQVREVIQEVLNEDQDMADMHLSDKKNGLPHTAADHQDVEYLSRHTTRLAIAYIRQTEETIQSILNVRRNQIMVLEAKIEIVMVGLATATLVAGYYGMNVVNYLEESAWAFGLLCSSSIIGTGLIWRYGMKQLRLIQRVKSANAPLSRVNFSFLFKVVQNLNRT
ncbi:unnamed protein product [Clonostachys rosea f. rosea IK726]|uniref:Uncharacterized protein n=1 Tax=Clonostachys rosea f. rosea IK726 TaxID=1349383 RepID=A0ACA9UD84_BIOOC|nr:unnamed protein product [Clonostachys rosea f. rosea IK726]